MPSFLVCYPILLQSKSHYKFEYKLRMIKTAEEIELEYQALRQTVQSKIKHLQSKLNKNQPQNRIPHHKHQHIYHTHHCHCHHCIIIQNQQTQRSCTQHQNSSDFNSNISNKQSYQGMNFSGNPSKFEDAVLQSLRNQRQISQHIKNINSKLDGLSQRDHHSNYTSQGSQQRKKSTNKNSELLYALKQQNQKHRSRSEAKNIQYNNKHRNSSNQIKTGQNRADQTLKVSQQRYNKNKMQPKHDKVSDSANKYANKVKNALSVPSHYEVRLKSSRSDQNIVPKHFPHGLLTYGKISLKDLRRKEVYRDAEHRNIKHQKDHLIESFKLQERMRKKLINKIMQNCFKEYGAK